jgi:hypothetical protein
VENVEEKHRRCDGARVLTLPSRTPARGGAVHDRSSENVLTAGDIAELMVEFVDSLKRAERSERLAPSGALHPAGPRAAPQASARA